MITVLPNLKMSVDQYNDSLLLQTKPQHPAEHHHPRELGRERRTDPLREGWCPCPLPSGTYPSHLEQTPSKSQTLGCTCSFTSSFCNHEQSSCTDSMFRRRDFSGPPTEQRHLNGICKCSDNILLLHLCPYQNRYSLFGKESTALNKMLLEAKTRLWNTSLSRTLTFTKPLKW